MTKSMMVVVALAAAGCGPSFAGKFSGTLTDTSACSDGSGSTTAGATTWDITDVQGSLSILFHGACDPIPAKQGGNAATITPKTCPSQISGGLTLTQAVTGGTLMLNEPNLTVNINGTETVSGAISGVCTDTVAGTLIRQK